MRPLGRAPLQTSVEFMGGSGQRGRHSNITAAESSPLERVSSCLLETGLLKTLLLSAGELLE